MVDIFATSQAFGQAILDIVALALGIGILGAVAFTIGKAVHNGLQRVTGQKDK